MGLFRQYLDRWVILFIVSIVLSVVLAARSQPDVFVAYVVGAVIAMFVFSYLLAGIPWLVFLLIRKRLTSEQFMSVFTVAFALIALS